MFALVVAGALFLLFTFLCGDRLDPMFAYRLAFPLMALGMAIVSLFFYDHWALSLLFVGIGYELFDIVSWTLFVDLAQRRGSMSGHYRVFGWGVAATLCGMGLGYLAGGWLGVLLDMQDMGVSAMGTLCVIALVATAFLVVPEGVVAQVAGWRQACEPKEIALASSVADAPAPSSLEARCELIACEFHLTPREGEVLVLLAKGRTLSIVMRDLQIAKGTAQTHIENVYMKLGVHKQQELIDLVEGVGSCGDA